MHKRGLFSIILILAATPVMAQEAPYSQTLDEQLTRVRAGQPAVPLASQNAPAASDALAPSAAMPNAVPHPVPVAYDRYGKPIDSVGSGAIPSLPLMEMISGEILFITGGVGDEEMEQLESVKTNYSFRLLIADKDGGFLSDCTLLLHDDQGTAILATANAGPYFYAKLKPGNYSLDVTTSRGQSQTVKVRIPTNGTLVKTVQFGV